MGEYDDDDHVNALAESKDTQEKVFLYGGVFFVFVIAVVLAWGLTSCTITQTMVHAEGQDASDVSESATTSPNIHPTTSLSLPLKAL